MKRWKKDLLLFPIGSAGYGLVETLWRGHTHWTMLVAGGVCFLINLNAGNRKQPYTMTEDCIIFGVGKASNPFYYKSIRKAVVYTGRNMIELHTLLGHGPVFVDHDEFGFVRDYILRRLPESAEIVYE